MKSPVFQTTYKGKVIDVYCLVPGSFYTTINGLSGGCHNACSINQAVWAAKESIDRTVY